MKNLLVPVDFSEVTARVVSAAEELATMFGAKVWLLHCIAENRSPVGETDLTSIAGIPDEQLPELFPDEHQELMKWATVLRNKGVETQTTFTSGLPIDVILGAAEQHSVDLIIVGSHGHGVLFEILVGTVAKFVLLRAGRPTLIIPSLNAKRQKSTTTGSEETQFEGRHQFTTAEFFGLRS